jgi:queuine tRNA-ribosyltransferase
LYTRHGIINIKNAKWQSDFSPIDEESTAPTSRFHTKAYLRHLFKVEELLAGQIATLQNLSFFLWLVGESRNKIREGKFNEWKNTMVKDVSQRL